ncbi:hypothetical protein [Nesterenkonia muleiensis]|uniref:hypothetical protein n=1 Tax=Nesterenkonia muleiensis TaxID=2282648 RepID=UPI000E716CC7|nr:hypothetical protein [Nesterenkonia muleiensis]
MPENTLLRATGLFGVAVLALTACTSGEDGPAAGEDDPTGDTGQEDLDPEGAEDQGDTPGEIADDPDEVPALADIEDSLWENSRSQDSVTVLSDVPAAVLGVQESDGEDALGDLEDEGDDAEAEPDEDAAEEAPENIDVIIGGDMLGDGSVWRVEGLMDYLLYDTGETIYQTVGSFVEEYREFQPDEAAGPSADELEAELASAGSWVDVTSTLVDQVETPERYIEHIETEVLAAAGIELFSEIGFSGEAESRDGEDVWVYLHEEDGESIELVVLADREEPLIRELSMEFEDAQLSITFADWNESEGLAEEEPDEEDVISEEELDAIGQSLM